MAIAAVFVTSNDLKRGLARYDHMLLLQPNPLSAVQRNCHWSGSCFTTRKRVAIRYAKGQVVGCGGHLCAGISYSGFVRQHIAPNLSARRLQRIRGRLPGHPEHLGFLPGKGRPDLRRARLQHYQ